MNFLTYVLTAPRPCSTLQRTLDSLVLGGWALSDITVFDGSPPPGVKPSPRGCTQAYKNIFKQATTRFGSEHQGVLVFEDDVVVCRGLLEYLQKVPLPEPLDKVAMLSPYCPTAYSNYSQMPRWHREDKRGVIAGTQAHVYTRKGVSRFLAFLDIEHRTNGVTETGVDVQMGTTALSGGLHIWYHVPSLVQHLGICNSAVGFTSDLGTIYSAETFVGEEYDARSMLCS